MITDFSGQLQIINVNGETDAGEEIIGVAFAKGAWPARASGDATRGITHFPNNANRISIELMERYNPVLFENTNLVPDTEGAGEYRSGFSPEWIVRNNSSENDINVSLTSAAAARRPEELNGGNDGSEATVAFLDRDYDAPTNGRTVLPPQERIGMVRARVDSETRRNGIRN